MATLETLDKAIDGARTTDAAEALISGVMLVRTQLFRILQEEGLERVSVLGLPYDPRSSEVVQRRPVTDPDQDGVVIEELQGGHQLRGHIIRRAKVVVGELSDFAPPRRRRPCPLRPRLPTRTGSSPPR
jgi:molecular chaperone GrpE